MRINNQDSDDFKEGIKGTSLFGGVQIFKIIVAILRSKVLAILLGPVGLGVLGLLLSTLDVIYSICNLGLGTSAVREISEYYNEGDTFKLSRITQVFKKLVWITGLFGLSICLFLSPYWSYASFGSYDYVFTFALLSLTILFRLLSEGQNSLLQGTHNLRLMAKSNIYGNVFGLILSIPFYYYFGIAGIGPSLFILYIINLLVSSYYSRKVKVEKIKVSLRESILEGRTMLKLGFFISISGLLSTVIAYIIRLFISDKGGLSDVGLYNAGFAIINTYVGMVFTAMGTEYFPRLSSFYKDNHKFSLAINHQMEISILLLAPLICVFVIFSDIGIKILYTSDFSGIDRMICFAILAIIFKAPSWCCSYAIIAKGDSLLFFLTEFASLVVMLISSIVFYKWWGLTGLGIAYILLYFYYLVQELLVCRKKYNIRISYDVLRVYIPHIILCLLCFAVVQFFHGISRYLYGAIPIIISAYFSLIKLDNRLNLRKFINQRIK